MRVFLTVLSSVALLCGGCADLLGTDGLSGTEKGSAAQPLGKGLGELSYEELFELEGTFRGPPLWVSNNPEDVEGYGLLSSTRAVGAFGARSHEQGAPSPGLIWGEEGRELSAQQGCQEGAFKRLNLYLAHILSSRHLAGGRRLSVVVEADEPLTLTYQGELGTTSWSDVGGFKTTRADWLGARVALDSLNRSSVLGGVGSLIEGELDLGAGERYVLRTVQVDSLVEGGLSLESAGGCFALHVVAHDAPLDVSAPLPSFAHGDVKWPGWYQGQGYGRAAGLYEGSEWLGEVHVELDPSMGAFGWRLFDAPHSPRALGRHGDSAELLFGGYGVVYETRLNLSNPSDRCLSAHLGFTSYANLSLKAGEPKLGDRRTPSVRDLHKSEPSKRPSMIWNGPIQFSQQLKGGSLVDHRLNVVLTPTIAQDEWSSPVNVPKGLHTPLLRWDLSPGEERFASVLIPVPGYIVAPAALTVELRPCP